MVGEKVIVIPMVEKMPKDAQVVMLILKEINIPDYEPRIVNQLLEFVHRYVTCVLDDAKLTANHARKTIMDLEDVNLATEFVLDKSFTCPPSRDTLSLLAEARNSIQLPAIKANCVLHFPKVRKEFTDSNFKQRASILSRIMTKSALDVACAKTQMTAIEPTSGGVVLQRPVAITRKAQTISIPKPVIKFITTANPRTIDVKPDALSSVNGDLKMEVYLNISINSGGVKRELEENEFEVVQ